MKLKFSVFLMFLLLTFAFLPATTLAQSQIDFSEAARIPVQYKGRVQPLQSLAIEVAQLISGRSKIKGLSSVEFLFDALAFPEKWYREPVIPIQYLPLKQALGFDENRKLYSFEELQAHEGLMQSIAQANEKSERDIELKPIDRKVQSIDTSLMMLNAAINGEILRMIPPTAQDEGAWSSIIRLEGLSQGAQEQVTGFFKDTVEAYRKNDNVRFQDSVKNLTAVLYSLNPSAQPPQWKLDWEIFYYKLKPFRYAWITYLISGLLFIFAWTTKKVSLRSLGIALFSTAFVFHAAGLGMRMGVLGRPPVSNMFESVVFMAWSVSFFSILLAAVNRRVAYLNAAAFVGALVLIWGSLMPFSPSLDVLVPVLRSNYWLTIHVLTIVSSYGAFALAAGLSHVVLGYFAWAPKRSEQIKDMTLLSYRTIQVGVILLAAGTILGGVWANESWGRFWGWDPKETWALISLLGYLAVMHARYVGWLREFGLAVGSSLCFLLVLMTWYGVNFVLGRGLHSYGFGAGGGHWVTGFLLFEAAFLGFTWYRWNMHSARKITVSS